ncbi:trem-like transcript 4 protein [Carlito syrichta]|uniref:Trem-like transcript 4 protein n=1 Tax=Carlito syrichta TaxID=1868482 RepID=A0A3Q0E826_CARSF|nr:trem-like transcript 4 protein [Carlito syrichta]
MAWGGLQLLLLLVMLVLLASGDMEGSGKGEVGFSQDSDLRVPYAGSQGKVVPEELHEVPGQTLLLQCQYSPKKGSYVRKAWCQQTSPNRCNILITSSKPRTAAQATRYTIWDETTAGFFNITMSDLTEEDSGSYWCGIYNSSQNFITVLRNISLVVAPAPTTSMWTHAWFPTKTALITSPEGTSGPTFINSSETRKSRAPPCLGSSVPKLLVSVLCGLLMAKDLVL